MTLAMLGKIISKSNKFLSKQSQNIAKYGETSVQRGTGVTNEILDYFTPFRRLSRKPCSLSDPKYAINKFEQEMGKDFLPPKWNSLTEAEKIDYIVRDRYSKLVSHKIMNKIQHETVEHGFGLDSRGEIVHYSGGNSSHCNIQVPENGITIHNHTGFIGKALDGDELSFLKKHKPDTLTSVAHGGEDINAAYASGERASYVVDYAGNKFLLEPSTQIRTLPILQRMQKGGSAMDILNKADVAAVEVFKINSSRSNIDKIYDNAIKYKQLEGTKLFNETEWLTHRIKFNEAKFKLSYPDMSFRESCLPEMGEYFGFRFSRLRQ